MPAMLKNLLGSLADVIRDVDATLATGSISNARRAVEENRRRDELGSAACTTVRPSAGERIAV